MKTENSNPFKYTKFPSTVQECQSNINYWWFEGFLTNDEIAETGANPANYRTFIREMETEEVRILKRIVEQMDNETL